jgi:CubicO group peptidase (beta-lactamase class C family)
LSSYQTKVKWPKLGSQSLAMMKCFMAFAGLSLFFSSYSQTGYKAPFFADNNRIEKIKATQAAIDKLYKEHAAKNHFPGFVYGVVADGKLIYTGEAGYTDIENKTPATVSSAFRIASMSKSFTAMAIVKLRDEGKLKLDDQASKYIPEMKAVKPLTTDAPEITVRHLLTHATGFPEDNPWGDRQLADTDKDLLDLVQNVSFSNATGIAYEYSNLGFALLGKIISNVTGKSYQQYITEAILEPLGMSHTYWEYTKVPAEKLALGYRWANNEWKEEPLLHDGSYGAMGGLITTIEDFSKYMQLHLSAWPARSEKEVAVIKRSSLREMQAPSNFNSLSTQFKYASGRSCATSSAYAYGLRWAIDCENKIFVGHTGGLPGFGSNWNILPDYGIGVVCFANVTYAPTGTFNLSILDTLIKIADLEKRITPPSFILEQRKNELIKLLPQWKDAQNSHIFAENFFLDYDPKDLQKEAALLFAKAGNIIRVHELNPENNLRGSFVLEGENTNLQISFTLTPEKNPLIQEYHIREVKK